MVMADIGIKDYEKHREIACHFDDHEDAAVRCGAHCLVAHIPGFTTNHKPPDAAIGQVPAPHCPSGGHGQ